MTTKTDALILGAGPAGLSCAMWLTKFGVDCLLIDRYEHVGGTVNQINLPVVDYLGRRAANGREFLRSVLDEFDFSRVPMKLGVSITRIDPKTKIVTADSGDFHSKAIILALGLSRRKLGIPGESEYMGKGITLSATRDRSHIDGKRVAVIGGSDGALENALILAETCPEVTLIHRRSTFRARGEFIERVHRNQSISLLTDATPKAVEGDGKRVTDIIIDTPDGERKLPIDWVVIKIGFSPNSGALPENEPVRDKAGFIQVDRYMRSSTPGIYAIGDIANPRSPSIAASVGDGAIAAREILEQLRSTGT